MSRTRKLRTREGEILATFVNPGEWFSRRWLIGVGAGFYCVFYVVEADCESDAIDELTDSDYGHIIKSEETCPCEDPDQCTCSYAGNFGERVDLDDIRVLRRLYPNKPSEA